MQEAVNQLWMYTGELFEYHQEMVSLVEAGIAVNPMDLKNNWTLCINAIMGECKLNVPTIDYMQTGSYHGVHTEHLGHLLSEMQYLQRAYPDAKW
jgi:ring-1,2-phenylacetyl-CoA epoxidase subunit PaaC